MNLVYVDFTQFMCEELTNLSDKLNKVNDRASFYVDLSIQAYFCVDDGVIDLCYIQSTVY